MFYLFSSIHPSCFHSFLISIVFFFPFFSSLYQSDIRFDTFFSDKLRVFSTSVSNTSVLFQYTHISSPRTCEDFCAINDHCKGVVFVFSHPHVCIGLNNLGGGKGVHFTVLAKAYSLKIKSSNPPLSLKRHF